MSDELAHYGVPGMKWGKRKSRATVKSSSDRKISVDNQRGKKASQLSNKQLKAHNSRVELEKKYSDLIKKPSTIDKINRGNNQAKAIIAVAGTAITVYQMANSPAAKAGAKFLKNLLADDIAGANWAGAPKNYAPFRNGAYRI